MDPILIPADFRMNPETDVLYPEGTELRVGMVVLLEDVLMRASSGGFNRSEVGRARALTTARWCEITWLRSEPNRNNGGRLISFVGRYEDGHEVKRTYDSSYAWYVKRSSISEES